MKMFVMESAYFREQYVKFVIGQTYFLAGCGFAFSALLIPKLLEDGTISTNKSIGWIAASGILLRPLVGGLDTYLSESIGRRGTLLLKLLLITIGWIVMVISPNILVCGIGRLITSLGLGFITSETAYIAETCSKNNFNTLVSISATFTTAGIVFCNILQNFFSWKITSVVIGILSNCILLQAYLIPETKYWYMMKNRRREAILSSLWFEKDKSIQEIQEELNKVERNIHNASEIHVMKILRNSTMIKPLVIYCAIVIGRIGTGYLVIVHYMYSIFKSLKNNYNAADLTLFTVILNLAFTTLLPNVIKRYKHRETFLISCITMIIAMGVTILYQMMYHDDKSKFSWVPVTCLFLYTTMNVAFFDPVISIMLSEIFPKSVNSFISWLHRLIEYKVSIFYILWFPAMKSHLGIEFIFWLFLLSSVACFVVIWYLLPSVYNSMRYERTNLFEDEPNLEVMDQRELLQSMIDEESTD